MIPSILNRGLGLLQHIASRVHLGRTRAVAAGDNVGLAKTRSARAGLLVHAANLYALLAHGSLRTLPVGEWIDWETTIWRSLYGVEIEARERGLFMPIISAPNLADVLRDQSLDPSMKMKAVVAACAALQLLHRVNIRWPDGISRPWSHSDASADNVLWDRLSNRAVWIDFETRHSARLSARLRAADDLLRLGYSTIAILGATSSPAVAAAMLAGYRDRAVFAAVLEIIRDPTRRLWRVHLWQPIQPESRHEFDRVLGGLAEGERRVRR